MEKIEEIIEYEFKDKALLNLATTHSSYAHKYNLENNERLEFLGDSILGFLVADFLYANFQENEGLLTKYRASLVSCEHLSKIITTNSLNKFIKTFPSNLNQKETVKGDFFEALLGAIYLDSNLETCKKFIYKFLNLSSEEVLQVYSNNQDYKTILQEKIQARQGKIEYQLISTSGEDNSKIFEIQLKIDGKIVSKAQGSSKQKAENKCAEIALKII